MDVSCAFLVLGPSLAALWNFDFLAARRCEARTADSGEPPESWRKSGACLVLTRVFPLPPPLHMQRALKELLSVLWAGESQASSLRMLRF